MTAVDDIQQLKVSAYTIPTDMPESDGTLKWESTTLVLVQITSCGKTGLGYTYANPVTAHYILYKLEPLLVGRSPFKMEHLHAEMLAAIRNDGQCGLAMMALSAIDIALWDLKARILDLPLCELIGRVHEQVQLYGSGGFTSYSEKQLQNQLGGWADKGFTAVKMKIGREPGKDPARIRAAREAIGNIQLFVDANGAFNTRQALMLAESASDCDVSWFEEPVSSADPAGLRFIREHTAIKMRIAAGEYGYTPKDFMDLLQHQAVDVLQADATRCGGVTGFLKTGHLAKAFHIPFSFHCAPALHLHAALCLPHHEIGEYFHDHVRIEELLFDGVQTPQHGYLKPDLSQPGLGLKFKHQDAEKFRVL